MTASRRTKRSASLRPLTIGLIGASAFALAGCKTEENVEASIWRADTGCAAVTDMTPAECEVAVAEAKAEHEATAPKYDAIEVCEKEHGAGNCEAASGGGGGMGSFFMPILMGYMMGKMMGGIGGGARAGAAPAKPLYSTPSGQMATADGQNRFQPNQTRASVPSQAFNQSSSPARATGATTSTNRAAPAANPSTTTARPPMSPGVSQSTGGFGSRAPAAGSSFGG